MTEDRTYTDAAPSHQAELKPILNLVSLPTMQSYLSSLTAFNNRYYKSTTGQQASVWIRDTVAAVSCRFPLYARVLTLSIDNIAVPFQWSECRALHTLMGAKLHRCQDPREDVGASDHPRWTHGLSRHRNGNHKSCAWCR